MSRRLDAARCGRLSEPVLGQATVGRVERAVRCDRPDRMSRHGQREWHLLLRPLRSGYSGVRVVLARQRLVGLDRVIHVLSARERDHLPGGAGHDRIDNPGVGRRGGGGLGGQHDDHRGRPRRVRVRLQRCHNAHRHHRISAGQLPDHTATRRQQGHQPRGLPGRADARKRRGNRRGREHRSPVRRGQRPRDSGAADLRRLLDRVLVQVHPGNWHRYSVVAGGRSRRRQHLGPQQRLRRLPAVGRRGGRRSRVWRW